MERVRDLSPWAARDTWARQIIIDLVFQLERTNPDCPLLAEAYMFLDDSITEVPPRGVQGKPSILLDPCDRYFPEDYEDKQ